jgi:hypothetical protein
MICCETPPIPIKVNPAQTHEQSKKSPTTTAMMMTVVLRDFSGVSIMLLGLSAMVARCLSSVHPSTKLQRFAKRLAHHLEASCAVF